LTHVDELGTLSFMSVRLQVLFDEPELMEIQAIARGQRMTTAEWVRQALRKAAREQPSQTRQAKLQAVRRAAAHQFPTADVEQMLDDIKRSYTAEPSP
jgi:predicted 2-oxoglutarate/Fe(II)-dependent dioxygenase YbiX